MPRLPGKGRKFLPNSTWLASGPSDAPGRVFLSPAAAPFGSEFHPICADFFAQDTAYLSSGMLTLPYPQPGSTATPDQESVQTAAACRPPAPKGTILLSASCPMSARPSHGIPDLRHQ